MLATVDTALYWRDREVSTLPILEKSKLPAQDWKVLQYRLPTDNEIIRWFANNNRNIGVVCGGKTNLVVLDFDYLENYNAWKSSMSDRNDVWSKVAESSYRVKTSRGMHVYIRTEEQERSRKIKSLSIDIRGNRGMVVAPPSTHPSGFVYQELSDRNIIKVGSTLEIFPDLYESNVIDLATKQCLQGNNFDFSFNQSIQDIKASIQILDYLSGMTYLKRTSYDGRWWMARCPNPAHEDRHPSFRIDTLLNRCVCLTSSCILYHSIGLDVIDLHMLLNNVDTKTAIIELSSQFL